MSKGPMNGLDVVEIVENNYNNLTEEDITILASKLTKKLEEKEKYGFLSWRTAPAIVTVVLALLGLVWSGSALANKKADSGEVQIIATELRNRINDLDKSITAVSTSVSDMKDSLKDIKESLDQVNNTLRSIKIH